MRVLVFAILVTALSIPATATICSRCSEQTWPSKVVDPNEPTYVFATCAPDNKGTIPDCQTVTLDPYTQACSSVQRVGYSSCAELTEPGICPPWGCSFEVRMPIPFLMPRLPLGI